MTNPLAPTLALLAVWACSERPNPGPDGSTAPLRRVAESSPVPETSPHRGAVETDAFIRTFASTNQLIIRSSGLALDRSAKNPVTDLARQLTDDHRRAADVLTDAVHRAGHSWQSTPELLPAHLGDLDQLGRALGSEFEIQYIRLMREAHTDLLERLITYETYGSDVEIRSASARVRPRLEDHLNRIIALEAEPPD